MQLLLPALVSCTFSGAERSDYERLGDSIMDTTVDSIREVLQESEAAFQGRRSVAQGSLGRLPQRNAVVDERSHPYAQHALARRQSIGAPHE